MAAKEEQIELLVSADTGGHTFNNSATSRASMHHGHNLTDFDVKYGRKADVNATSCGNTFLSCGCEMTCRRDKVFGFIERHFPVVNLIRTYKVCFVTVNNGLPHFTLFLVDYTIISLLYGLPFCCQVTNVVLENSL